MKRRSLLETMPYSRQAEYYHKRQKNPRIFINESFKTVPITHTSYSGKYRKEGNMAVVGKIIKTGKWSIQSILVKKK